MRLTLKGKADVSHKDNLIIQYVEMEGNRARKITESIALGETIDLPDDVAYDVMARYRGCFIIEGQDGAKLSDKTKQYAHRSAKGYADKSAQSEA